MESVIGVACHPPLRGPGGQGGNENGGSLWFKGGVEPGRAPAGEGRELLTPWGDERDRVFPTAEQLRSSRDSGNTAGIVIVGLDHLLFRELGVRVSCVEVQAAA